MPWKQLPHLNVTSITHCWKILLLPSFKQEMPLNLSDFSKQDRFNHNICNVIQDYYILTDFWDMHMHRERKSNYLKKEGLGFQQNLGSGVTYKGLVQWEDFLFKLNENERCFSPVNCIMTLLEIWDDQFLLGDRVLGKLICQLNTKHRCNI